MNRKPIYFSFEHLLSVEHIFFIFLFFYFNLCSPSVPGGTSVTTGHVTRTVAAASCAEACAACRTRQVAL